MGVALIRRGTWFWLDISQDGRRTRKPVHTQDRRKAELIRHEVEDAILAGEWNVALATRTTFARAAERYREEYEALHHAPSTRKYTARTFKLFGDFLSRRHGDGPTLDRIGRADIELFQLERSREITVRKRPPSAHSVNRTIRDLKTFFGWAKGVGLCRKNPCDGVKPLRAVKRKVQPLLPQEIEKLLPALPETLADLARVILNSGLRLGEALHLRREDVSLEGRLLWVRSRPDYLIKDREEREIPLVDPAVEVLRRRLLQAGSSPLLFASSDGTVLNSRNALRDLYRACRQAGLRRANWYLMRHTFASVQARVLTPAELKTILGHADIRTADRYYVHLSGREAKLKAVAGVD